MRRRESGFTLIELLMVVLVIGLLVVMLVPAVGAVKRAVRISMTETRIWEIDSAIGLYKDTFGDYPPSGKPYDVVWNYPRGWVPDDPSASAAGSGYGPYDINDSRQWLSTVPGGQFLTYFLFGPMRFGWVPEQHGVSVNWAPPAGLERYLTKKPLRNIGHSNHYYYVTPPYWYFEDAFGLTGRRFAGAILYLRANTRYRVPIVTNGEEGRFNYWNVAAQYYWETRVDYGGDGDGPGHLAKLVRQTSKPFVLISAGADHRFGYMKSIGNNRIGAHHDGGATDDICNFTHD